jgi:hypothetical protein
MEEQKVREEIQKLTDQQEKLKKEVRYKEKKERERQLII